MTALRVARKLDAKAAKLKALAAAAEALVAELDKESDGEFYFNLNLPHYEVRELVKSLARTQSAVELVREHEAGRKRAAAAAKCKHPHGYSVTLPNFFRDGETVKSCPDCGKGYTVGSPSDPDVAKVSA